MRLEQLGQIKLNDPVAKYIPDFGQNGKEDVTIRMLLTHYSGLPADLDLKQAWNGLDEGYSRANAAKLVNPPGSTFLYSDVGFVVLGELVQKVSGMPLDQYAQHYVFGPLGMTSTRFNPPMSSASRIAPTQRDEHTGQMLRGYGARSHRAARWAESPAMPDCSPPPTMSRNLRKPCSTEARRFCRRSSWRR